MELNREQIIKALECCVKVGGYRDTQYCNDCPLHEELCAPILPQSALAIIKKLTKDVESWKEIAEQYQRQFDDCAEDRAKLTEENERLRSENEEQDEAIIRALKAMGEIRRASKADTVREMQERLNKLFCNVPEFLGVKPGLAMDIIDQTVKEMLED